MSAFNNKTKISPNSVALAGEFAVLSRLALCGYDATMTLGRTKSVDILVSDPKTNQLYQLEVKTAQNRRNRPPVSKIHGRFLCDWMIQTVALVARFIQAQPNVFVGPELE